MRRVLTVAQRLALAFGVLLVMLLLISTFAWTALQRSDAAMKTIYEDRTVALRQLAAIRHVLLRNRILLSDAAERGDAAHTDKRLSEYASNWTLADHEWRDYMATYLTPEEAGIAKTHEAALKAYREQGMTPVADALRQHDHDTARQLAHERLGGERAMATLDSLRDLIDLQVRVAKATYEDASRDNQQRLLAILMLGVLSGVLATLSTTWVTRRITRQLGAEPHELADVAQRIASGDLTLQSLARAPREGSVMAAMQSMRRTLNDLVHTVRQSVDSVATASGQIAHGNQDLSARTEEQASSLQQTAASMEQLNSTIQSTADHALSAQRMAQDAAQVAQRGGDAMRRVVHTFDGIQAASRRISEIIGVIDGIAFQTNILALNAAVEAARAGEQGRGFAVVAGEVRTLAQRSAEASKQIKQLITETVEQIDGGSALIGGVGDTINEVVNRVESVSGLIGQIALQASEQSTGVSQIDDAMQQLDQTTQQNAALVEEAAAAAASLRAQAGALSSAVAVFKAQAVAA
ncbi:methyl-accepting chemotaxis protein [Roseateles sp. BYS87W]|uniref:Methyl-accepting chemotaxis protein n=1 Tax=Pelomonas baiyunensis TaxID=3299026 RepID=A0ABW7GVJ0_9BURK